MEDNSTGKNEYFFTVMVETYNTDWSKLRLTLNSILRQSFSDYEIVIADDGSAETLEDKVRAYFKAKSFDRFTLVMNKENQGTVRNIISGLKVAKGRYIRDFGVGDLFADTEVLKRLHVYLAENEYEAVAGLMKGFTITDKGVLARQFNHPFDIQAYRKGRDNRILRNLAIYSDNFSGAALCMQKDYYLEYMERISPIVKYKEDIFQLLAALEGRRVVLWNDYMVLYEMGSGISTGGSGRFAELLAKDTDSFYEYIIENYSDNKYVKKRAKLQKYYKYRNVYIRTVLRFTKNPGLVLYLISHYIQVLRGCYKKGK